MTLTTYDVEQRSERWYELRCGLVTASLVGKLIAVGPPEATSVECPDCKAEAGNPCVSRARKTPTPIKTLHDYRVAVAAAQPPVYTVADNDTSHAILLTLATERIAGWVEDLPMTSDMWRGVDAEPYARDLYDRHHGKVTEVGFMIRDEKRWSLGYSPDGLVGRDGLIEIKSPRAKNHVATILADEVPAQYMAQLQAGLLVTGRKWADFVSYCGGLPLYRKRVEPDPKWFAAIKAAVIAAEAAITTTVADYRKRVEGLPPTPRIDFNTVELKLA